MSAKKNKRAVGVYIHVVVVEETMLDSKQTEEKAKQKKNIGNKRKQCNQWTS